MKKANHPLLTVFFLLVTAMLLLGSFPQPIAAGEPTPAETVHQAWNLARASGRYDYRSLIEQTVYPAPAVTNAGRPPRTDRLGIEGNVDLATETLNLTLWDDGSFNPNSGLAVKIEDGQAYARQGQGAWKAVDNVADIFAPGGDPLGFLAGASNIQADGTESREINGQIFTFSRYTFEMDGPAFADYMLAQIEDYQAKYGPPPAGVELAPPETYQRMSGRGQLWLNAAGLPARLVIDIELPDQPKAGQRLTAHVSNDYYNFDQERIGQAKQGFWNDPAGWLTYHLSSLQPSLQQAQTPLQLSPLFFLLALLCLRYWQTRHFYAIVAITLILAMLLTPLLQGQQVLAYYGRLNAEQKAHEEQQAKFEEQQAYEEGLANYRQWDPHQTPLAQIANPPRTVEQLTSTTDSDNDGLSDEDEGYWGTCAYTFGSANYLASEYCDNVADPTDSDNDGLGDATEISYLNTYPTSADTDGDSITDTLEITGFTYAGRTWYLDPINEDSNDDGLIDSGECSLTTIIASQSLSSTACPDTDNDGLPNLFDDDNDGDGIDDENDLSPIYASPSTYDNNNPLNFSLNNFTVGEPILLDIQLQPTNAEHLNYYYHVLDWPADDDGQIERHLDTTWATTSNTTYQSDDDNADNGDIRLIPMLEIIMPYSDGHYANLPVNTTYYGTNRTLGLAVDNWLDTTDTKPYSMSIDDLDLSTGDLVAYVPLSIVSDDYDTPVGYTARILYEPSQSSWGEAHEYRVVWLVQMLTDECENDDDDEDTCTREDNVTVIHTYDESWTLTGLNVSEEQGLDVALLYEDPAGDENLAYDDQLWIASWNLGNTFLRGRDCSAIVNGSCTSDGQRDVTIANMASQVSSWGLDYTEVDTFSYEHQGFATYIMMTETVNILDTVFTSYAGNTIPTILVVQEHSSQTYNLDSYSDDITSGLTIDLASSEVPLQIQASLSWASYDYVDGEWTNYGGEEYLEYLSESLETTDYFQPADSSQDSEDEAEGKLLWAQTYYASLYAGAESIVEADLVIVWDISVSIPEVDLDPVVPVNTTWGASTIAYEFAIVYASKSISVQAYDTGIWSYFKQQIQSTADDSYQFTRFNQGGLSANKVALVTILAIVLAVSFIIAGLITGNDLYVQIGIKLMSIITIIVTTFYLINAIQAIVKAVQAATGAMAIISAGLSAGRWFQGVGVIGFLIGTVITWGVIGFIILTKGLSGVALGYALAYAIAATIVLFIYLILDLIGLGVIVFILILLDALFALFGAEGPTQLLTEAIADTLYGVSYLIKNLEDTDRLELDLAGMGFTNDEAGFVVSNSFVFTTAVTNTLRYGNSYSFSDFENNTVFRYHAQRDETDQHAGLTAGDMTGEWVVVDSDEARTTAQLILTVPLSNIGTGIAQSLDGEFYLTEAYLAAYQGCWKFAGIPTDCSWYHFSDSAHINMGQELVYDILPASLAGFAAMDWDDELPDQADLDNDGLLAASGTDPNDEKADSDGDGLSDYYEITYGLDAESGDGDLDGLNDADETSYGTDPDLADSDGDGLNDYLETKVGWLVVYKNNGVNYLTRVWSDPNLADADQDTLNDLEEFLFGFHPQVTSDPDAFTTLVQFNDLEVVEDTGLVLLTKMEDGYGSETFSDSSGNELSATCSGSTCPTLEVSGRYAYGASFDGSNDYLETDSTNPKLAFGDFSIGAWLKTTANNRGIVTKSDGDNTWELYEKAFYLSGTGRPTFVGWGNGYIQSTTAVNDGEWHYVMVVWDYSGSGSSGTAKMYVDGVDVTNSSTNYAANRDDAASHTLQIGRPNFGEAPFYFSGSLDEVVVFERALSPDEVNDMYNGRYNVNDLVAPPDTDLTYRTTVTNSSSMDVAGFLSADTAYLEPEIAHPVAAYSFEEDERVAYFANDLGEGNNVSCIDDGHCPTAGIDGALNNGLAFDGLDDYAILPALNVESENGFSLNFWLWVDSLPASGNTAMILDTNSTETGALDVYLNSSGNLVFDIINDSTTTSNYSFSTHLNQWVHVSFNEGNIFINASSNTSGGYPAAFLGPGRLGNNVNGDQPFDGRLDELVYYDQNLDDGGNGGTSFNAINDVKNGSYYTDKTPLIIFPMDELLSYDGTTFYDGQSNSNHATCSNPACPTVTADGEGYSGRAITLDGSNDTAYQPGSYSTSSTGEVTVSFYVKLSAYPASNAYIFDTTSGTDVLDMYINSSGKIVATRQEGTHTSTGSIPLNSWTQVSLTYDRYTSSGLFYYDSRIYFDGVLDSTRNYLISGSTSSWNVILTIGSGYIGSQGGSSNFFAGSLDEMSLAVSTLSFDPTSTNFGYQNLANDLRASSCNDVFICPTSTNGVFDSGISLDGSETYLDLGQVLDPTAGDFSAAIWFKVNDYSNRPIILQQTDGDGTGRSWFYLESDGRLSSFLGGSTLVGTTPASLNTWHHAALVYEGTTLSLYLDGNLEATTTRTVESSDGDFWLGRHKSQTTRYFNGDLDELIIIPAAIDNAGVQLLMNTSWPIITIPALFESFNTAALTNLEVSGTAEISPYASGSQHQFDQEVEAALSLQADIDYPIVDDNVDDLTIFIPFEETPGSTSFENLILYYNDTVEIHPTCSGDRCPTAGLRGQIDRAVYFDGLDDYLEFDFTAVSGSWRPTPRTVSVWLYGKQGTIISSYPYSGTGFELDFNRLKTESNDTQTTTSLDLPQNEWFHLAMTIDTSDVMTIYVNGVASTTASHSDSFLNSDIEEVILGANVTGQDMYEGFMDDLRVYDVALSAAEILTLYEDSAPLLRFEFDEEEGNTAFVDNSVAAYVGHPTLETCAALSLDSLTINSLAVDPSLVYVSLDGERVLEQAEQPAGTALTPNTHALLCEQQTLSVGITANGTSTTLGSASLNVASPGSTSQTFSSGGNAITLFWTVDSTPVYQPNPAPGSSGRIANGAIFDGDGQIEVSDTTLPLSLIADFTIQFWIKTTATSTGIVVKNDSDSSWEQGEKALYLNSSGQPTFVGWGNSYIRSNTAINDDNWHFVAVVWDYSGSGTTGTGKIYIDGVDATGTVNYRTNNADNSGNTLKIGASNNNTSEAPNRFAGQLDELAIYQRALSQSELYSIYLREIRWYRDQAISIITIDTDTPTIELLSDATYWPYGYIQLAVATTDATSGVALLDVGLKAPGDTAFSWSGATECQDNGISGAAWCPYFDTSTLGGEGKYEIQFRAVDGVGNETTSSVYTFYVDGISPTASGSFSGQWLTPTTQDDGRLSWEITLSGTLSDPDINTTPTFPGSGVDTNTVLVELLDDDTVIGEGQQAATVSGSNWSIAYHLEGARPQGSYLVQITLEDNVGNVSLLTLGTVKLDERPPRVTFNSWGVNSEVISTTVTLQGNVSDQADWAGEMAHYAFEEDSRATIFYDSSENGVHLNCADCPTVVSSGVFGQALDFDGVNDSLFTYTGTNTAFEENALTLAAWVKPDELTTGVDRLISLGDEAAVLRIENQQLHFYVNIDNTLQHIRVRWVLTAGVWQHVAGTYDGQTMVAYVNGVEVGSLPVVGEIVHTSSPLQNMFLSSGLGGYNGQMDEVGVYDRALSDAEIYALAQSEAAGIEGVEIGLESFDFTGEALSAISWYAATVSGGSWQYTIPANIEGLYNLYLRGRDNFDNESLAQVIWRGVLDTKPPAVVASGQLLGSGSAAQTAYSFTFSDFVLDSSSYVQPCGENEVVSLTYSDATLPHNGLPYQLSGSCQMAGHESGRDFTVCDGVGHCTTLHVTPAAAPSADSVAILSPANLSEVETGAAVSLSGGAHDGNVIQSIVVTVDGVVVDTVSGGGATDMTWSVNWTPAGTGTVTIVATMTDNANNILSDTIQLIVVQGNPTAITLSNVQAEASDYWLWAWVGLLALLSLACLKMKVLTKTFQRRGRVTSR